MPTTRRRGGQTGRSQQSTLSFGTQSRVTKPSSTSAEQSKKIKDVDPVVDDVESPVETPATPVEPEQVPVAPAGSSKPHIAELVVREQARVAKEQPLSEEDRKALKISDAQIKQYWKKEEEKRKAPRVHQEDLSLNEKILRHFDLSSQYGPCIGIARLQRWRRAHDMELNPPLEVLAVLLKEGKEPPKQRAHIDELLS